MSKIKKLLTAGIIIAISVDVVLYFYVSLRLWAFLNIIAFIFALAMMMLLIANSLLKKTNWYKNLFVDYDHEIYPDNIWYRKHDERNYDIVALGSSGAMYAYDFTDCEVKGMNWAQQPQSLLDDFKLLKTFHSILRKKGVVLINIMPFSSCNKLTGLMDAFKYLGTYYESKYFDQRYYKKALLLQRFPIFFGKSAIVALYRYFRKLDLPPKARLITQPMSKLQLQQDAQSFINGWKKQFDIVDFDAPLTFPNVQGRYIRVKVLREMIDFIIERDYVPVYVIPPVTEHLSKYYTKIFKETYIYSFLQEVDREVRILDYSNDKNLSDDALYFNSFFMNKTGASKFTSRVLTDLGLI